jgi:hypothetical protein
MKQKQKTNPAMVIIAVVVAIVLVFAFMFFRDRKSNVVDLSNVSQMPEIMKMKMKVQGGMGGGTPQGQQAQPQSGQ